MGCQGEVQNAHAGYTNRVQQGGAPRAHVFFHATHKYLFHMAACLRLQVRERKFRAQLVEQIT